MYSITSLTWYLSRVIAPNVLPLSALLLSTLKLVILNILLGREPQLKLILMYVQRLHNIAHGLLDGNQFWKLRNQ